METQAPVDARGRILLACKELFFAHGIRAVTMDDVATRLGMSKKTIYQYFTQKEEIVRLLAETHIAEEKQAYRSLLQDAENALDALVKVTVWDMHRTREINPLMPQEVRRYFPQTWQLFQDYSNGFILDIVQQNLVQGIREGLYRAEIDVEALARINVSSWDSLTNPVYFPPGDYPLARLQYEYMLNYLHGIVTPHGAALLQQYLIATPIPH